MKKPNNTSWEALDKAWQKQIHDQADEVPAGLWDQINARLNEKPARPMWARVRLSPWTWSAAAVIAMVIGINWDSNKPIPQQTLVAQTKVQVPTKEQIQINTEQERPERVSRTQSKPAIVRHAQVETTTAHEQPVEMLVPNLTIGKAEEKSVQSEEIWVRVDIDPVEEIVTPVRVAKQAELPIKKKKTFVGRLLKQVKQVVAGEQLDWQQLKEGNQPLEDGIHQVANTYYRTEQTIKQTFQIQ